MGKAKEKGNTKERIKRIDNRKFTFVMAVTGDHKNLGKSNIRKVNGCKYLKLMK
jgi:hypothetical protein